MLPIRALETVRKNSPQLIGEAPPAKLEEVKLVLG